MISHATPACTRANRTKRSSGARRPAAGGRPRNHTSAHNANIGSSSTAENLTTQDKPKTTPLRAARPGPGDSRSRHHDHSDARKKKTMMASEVARAPCARNAGQNAYSASERNAPFQPKNWRDQKKMSSPVAAL